MFNAAPARDRHHSIGTRSQFHRIAVGSVNLERFAVTDEAENVERRYERRQHERRTSPAAPTHCVRRRGD
jgi:hypothetical protein